MSPRTRVANLRSPGIPPAGASSRTKVSSPSCPEFRFPPAKSRADFTVIVPVLDDDTEASLSARILKAEHRLYPLVIDSLAGGFHVDDFPISVAR